MASYPVGHPQYNEDKRKLPAPSIRVGKIVREHKRDAAKKQKDGAYRFTGYEMPERKKGK